MGVIDDLVAQAEKLVRGINWDSLDSRSVGVPLDPQQDAHLNYWVEYLAPAFTRAANVMDTLYYDPIIVNHAATEDSLGNVWESLKAAAPHAWEQITVQNLTSNLRSLLYSAFGTPVPLPADQMRNVISYVWSVVMFGTKLHTTFAIVNVGRAAMREHANRIVMLCEAIALLDQIGALTQLKWDSSAMVELRERQGVSALKPFAIPAPPVPGVAGLGVAPAIIALGAMLGAVVLMYGIYRWTSMATEINKETLRVTKDLCSDPNYVQDPAAKSGCVKVLGDALAKSTAINPFGPAFAKYAVIGGVVILAVIFAPTLIRSLKGAAAEARKPSAA